MKRLISEKEVLNIKDSDDTIFVDKNTIITAQAIDVAKELGIKIIRCEDINKESNNKANDNENLQKNVEIKKPILSEDEIYELLKKSIDSGLLSEDDLEGMMG